MLNKFTWDGEETVEKYKNRRRRVSKNEEKKSLAKISENKSSTRRKVFDENEFIIMSFS